MNIRQQLDFAFPPDQEQEQIRGPLLVAFNNALQRCQQVKTRLGDQASHWAELGNLRAMHELTQLRNKEITALTELLNSYVTFGELIAYIEQNNLLSTYAKTVFAEYTRLLTESLHYTSEAAAAEADLGRFHRSKRKIEIFSYEIPDANNILTAAANALRHPTRHENISRLSAAVDKHQARFDYETSPSRLNSRKTITFIALACIVSILAIASTVLLIAAAAATTVAPSLLVGIACFFVGSWGLGAVLSAKGVSASISGEKGSKIQADQREINHSRALTRFAGFFSERQPKSQPQAQHREHAHRPNVRLA